MSHATVWFDGACSGNPGPMGAGAVVEIGPSVKSVSRALGRGTNNEAEYQAVIAGLNLALQEGADTVTVRGDSQLVLRQLEGTYAVKAANLRMFHAEAQSLLGKFRKWRLEWVPREENAAADRLANQALGRPVA